MENGLRKRLNTVSLNIIFTNQTLSALYFSPDYNQRGTIQWHGGITVNHARMSTGIAKYGVNQM